MITDREMIEKLLSPSTLKILKLFINHDDQRYYLREVAKLTKVPPASTYRILQQLVDITILSVEQIKRFKLYSLNTEKTFFLSELLQDRKNAVAEFVNTIKEFDGVQMVVLHGKEEKDKANVLVIGTNLDTDSIKRNAVYMGEKFSFNIILLTLTPEQYNQMSSMGLYPGKKKILFEA
ncbi:helix-turn-helix domain-containing protein [Candidatus Woesearchaeota archaeon]|nr:helix-turn-helix domain-containing protein [Candidatus Woesearchaeota archaeon]